MRTLSLDGHWELHRSDQPEKIIPAQVPGSVHEDLLRAGLITDPFWRDEELAVQWVGKTAWTYKRDFDVSPDLLAHDRVLLRAEGLDTLGDVYLNGQHLASVDNQHVTWEWEVRGLLRAGANQLEIRFAAPDAFLAEKGKINPLSGWNQHYDYKHRGWLRKAHSNFGWDWAPVLVSCGVWRPISLIAFSGARLDGVRIGQTHATGGAVSVDVHVAVESSRAAASRAEIELSFADQVCARAAIDLPASTRAGCATLQVPEPRLWWPHGLGEQPLYTVKVRLLDGAGAELDSWRRRIGLRTLVLARRPDAWGESFQFECNGVPFFAKGSNWVNPLPYPSWPREEDWQPRLRDAVAAHMNMIRLWGGAYFAPDAFFDLCDELGLAVWQDFLFACGPYPGSDQRFLASVEKETRDNVARLAHHACIALWCGNNELEPTFVGSETTDKQMSVADYDRVFHQLLPRVVGELAPQASYWPASPAHPTRDRTLKEWPFPQDAGDTHIWELWFSESPFENYRNYLNRFVSEFGFQSFPGPKTFASYTLPEDRQLNSPVADLHQRSGPGNRQIVKFLAEWFRFAKRDEDVLVLTQLVQANAVKTGVEHWRRNMPRTMGALYWQLNDCWPCTSWSSIDYFGRWKALHHFATRFFAPVLVSGLEDTAAGTVAVHLTSDLRRELRGEVRWQATDLNGRALQQGAWTVTLPPASTREIGVATLAAELKQHGANNLLVWLDFAEPDTDAATAARSSNLVLFERPRRFRLPESGLRWQVSPRGDGSYDLAVTTDKPALWVWLDTADFDTRFSDNYRSLRAGETWKVVATPASPVDARVLTDALRVRDLRSTYAA